MNKARKRDMAVRMQAIHGLLERNQFEEARQRLEALESDALPEDQLDTELAKAYRMLGDHVKSIACSQRVLKEDPGNVQTLCALAATCLDAHQYDHAQAAIEQALQHNPESVPALALKGALLLLLNRHEEAAHWLEKAVALKTMDANVYGNLALALGLLGRNDEALVYADQARRRDPKNPSVLSSLARALVALGRMDEAQRHLLKAIEYTPTFGAAYERLAAAKKFTRSDLPFIEQAVARLATGMRVVDRQGMLFAIGKMYDDIGEYEKSFQYFRQGNVLARDVDKPDEFSRFVRCQKKLLTAERLAAPGEYGHGSDVPVFIVGMPRSGTSLMEQIIDSHPDAAGAGELTEIPLHMEAIYKAARHESRFGPERFELPVPALWQERAEAYLQVLRAGRADALRVVDKLPDNYRFLGLIAMMFPKARIIHAVRHPLDVCTSCYFQLFMGLKWSFDLKWIAETYCEYRELMAYWKSVLPAGRIVDVHYEQLIADPEPQARGLIDACGLPWDPACLDYAKNTRGVQTASAWQVRQPIYQTSKMRWVNYAPYIGELAQGVVEYLDDNDIEILAQHGVKVKRKRWKLL